MNGVNVLAVMDDAIEVLLDERSGKTAINLDAARAAIAELIDVCNKLKRDATSQCWNEFHYALDRVKGEK